MSSLREDMIGEQELKKKQVFLLAKIFFTVLIPFKVDFICIVAILNSTL